MKIRARLAQLKARSRGANRWISITSSLAEYHPENAGFFLEDVDEYTQDTENHTLDYEVDSEHEYQVGGVRCIGLTFDPRQRVQ